MFPNIYNISTKTRQLPLSMLLEYHTLPEKNWRMLAALQTCSIIITYESRYIASSSFLEGVANQELVVTTEVLYFQKV